MVPSISRPQHSLHGNSRKNRPSARRSWKKGSALLKPWFIPSGRISRCVHVGPRCGFLNLDSWSFFVLPHTQAS